MLKKLITSESVTEGHPDKICDQISDAILDAIMEKDPYGRVACETCITTGLVLVMGEITTNANIDVPSIVRNTVRKIGYNDSKYGFDADTCGIIVCLDKQSEDIALGVNEALEAKVKKDKAEIGAGDQGMMFGYATNETKEYMPLPIVLAHKLSKQLSNVRKSGRLKYLRPDGKTQVTIEYDGNIPKRIDTIVCSVQHDENISQDKIYKDILKYVIEDIIPEGLMDDNTNVYVNPTGRFVIGGPHGDSGVTGRKIIVDTYGGCAHHGGGAFSGKDCTKVDRSAAYMARYLAKNIVAVGLAEKCEVQLSYAIGIANPVSVNVNTFGTGKKDDELLAEFIYNNFDLTPSGIIDIFKLRRPIYEQVASYGHFGRTELNLPWEQLDTKKFLGILEV
ncbi:methionine adenosyltransferase [Blautia stercoris]|jgi:S-adenosylmethionine synthetase|uniref:methionine adenosyltransferase n=1 Tax=Bacillota TaxID=1239 RepID=UPI000E4BFE1E|nr:MULTISPECIES: methionine adenosyltransferase [Bacillota]RGF67294.1 methionine adenosyltransferase [Ruminococcus sp. AF31-8BH]RGW12549.1 methionine adenosyltransferase [Ruminococcus sp. AF13-37]RGW16442.1 methionine adenosyltransferase [Ruminococcus sp. AF13-28]RHS56652.1 methionine adenosyltransferase [Ruminococcus sp. AM45-9BH]